MKGAVDEMFWARRRGVADSEVEAGAASVQGAAGGDHASPGTGVGAGAEGELQVGEGRIMLDGEAHAFQRRR